MSVKTYIEDGRGSNRKAGVDTRNNLLTSDTQLPQENGKSAARIFRQHMTDDGLVSDGTNNDMQRVGTAAAPINFYIPAPADADRYIKTVIFTIADATAVLNNFGNITALTNGCHLYYEDTDLGQVTIDNALKSNYDFIKLAGASAHGIGTGTSSYRASNVLGASEGYIAVLDFAKQFGIPWGVRLRKGSNLRLVMAVQDDTTGVDQFDAVAYGFDRLINE
jgi:hypothetical protein